MSPRRGRGRRDRLAAMVRIARSTLQHTELDDLLAAITRELSSLIDFDRSSVALMSPDGTSLILRHVHKGGAATDRIGDGRTVPLNERSVIGWVAMHREPILRPDILADGRFLEVVAEEHLGSDMVVPLVACGRVLGTINVGSYTKGALTQRDLDLLVECGEIACGVIEHMLLRREAQEMGERYRLLRRNARDIIVLLDQRDGRVLEVNRTCCEALARTEEELLGTSWFDLVPGDGRAQARRDFVNILSQKTRAFFDRRLLTRDGGILFVDVSADLMEIRGETFVQLLVHDVSERKQLERRIMAQNQRLQEANRRLTEVDSMKTEFLQTISHELRTPLSVIIAYTESLHDETLSRESREEFLGIVAENGQHLLHLIDDLLDLSRLELSGAMLSPTLSHLHDVIRAAWRMVEVDALHKGLELEFLPGRDVPVQSLDNRRIQQVVLSLLHNAVKFTPPGGRVEVSTRRAEHEVVVQVADTGRGIPAEDIPHIFDAFRQIDGSSTRRTGGMGIGLAMAKHIVELHEGRLWVESEEGVGSTFAFALPVGSVLPVESHPETTPAPTQPV